MPAELVQRSLLRAYHGSPDVKRKYLDRVHLHRAQDDLIRGTGWSNGKGCAVGCTLEAYDHARYPIELGIPEGWAQLEDTIFESLPREDAMEWPLQFLNAIPVGADLYPAMHTFCARVLEEVSLPAALAVEKGASGERVKEAVARIIRIHRDTASGKHPSPWQAFDATFDAILKSHGFDRSAAWSAAESAARSAAESAARSAAESAAESAAWSAAESAAESAARSAARSAAWSAARSAAESAARSAARSAAESAARSAAESAARSAARSAAWRQIRDIALDCLRTAPQGV